MAPHFAHPAHSLRQLLVMLRKVRECCSLWKVNDASPNFQINCLWSVHKFCCAKRTVKCCRASTHYKSNTAWLSRNNCSDTIVVTCLMTNLPLFAGCRLWLSCCPPGCWLAYVCKNRLVNTMAQIKISCLSLWGRAELSGSLQPSAPTVYLQGTQYYRLQHTVRHVQCECLIVKDKNHLADEKTIINCHAHFFSGEVCGNSSLRRNRNISRF